MYIAIKTANTTVSSGTPFLRRQVFVPEGELYNPVCELGNEVRNMVRAALPWMAGNLPFPLATCAAGHVVSGCCGLER